MGLLIDSDVVAKPVDLHRLRRAHGLAREVEGTVFGDIQLLGLTNEVWEPCTDTSREARDSESSATQPYRQPQTVLPGAMPSSGNKPLPIQASPFLEDSSQIRVPGAVTQPGHNAPYLWHICPSPPPAHLPAALRSDPTPPPCQRC